MRLDTQRASGKKKASSQYAHTCQLHFKHCSCFALTGAKQGLQCRLWTPPSNCNLLISERNFFSVKCLTCLCSVNKQVLTHTAGSAASKHSAKSDILLRSAKLDSTRLHAIDAQSAWLLHTNWHVLMQKPSNQPRTDRISSAQPRSTSHNSGLLLFRALGCSPPSGTY